MSHETSLCDGCGQSDDHPKIHVWGPVQADERTTVTDPSFHFDCPPEVVERLLSAADVAAGEAARRGTRGPDLAAFIADYHAETSEA